MTLYQFIERNQHVVESGYKLGVCNASVMAKYRLATEYKKLSAKLGKMTRYQWVADEQGVSVTTVRSAVKDMGV